VSDQSDGYYRRRRDGGGRLLQRQGNAQPALPRRSGGSARRLGLGGEHHRVWNTLYMTAAVERLKQHGYPVLDEDLAQLSPLIFEHINMLGRYSRGTRRGRQR